MKHNSLVVDFSNLDFEKIDIEILADEAKELEETSVATVVRGADVGEVGNSNLSTTAWLWIFPILTLRRLTLKFWLMKLKS